MKKTNIHMLWSDPVHTITSVQIPYDHYINQSVEHYYRIKNNFGPPTYKGVTYTTQIFNKYDIPIIKRTLSL